ncbi:MAG: hypothetical protein ACREF3_20125 [Acetobacteraceae bacterium]
MPVTRVPTFGSPLARRVGHWLFPADLLVPFARPDTLRTAGQYIGTMAQARRFRQNATP